MADQSQPSTFAVGVACGIIGVTAGYMIGVGESLGFSLWKNSGKKNGPRESWPNSYDVKIHPDSSDEELMASLKAQEEEDEEDDDSSGDEGPESDLATFAENREECKMVLVVRTDLGMGKGMFFARMMILESTGLLISLIGKIAAQCSHATLACYNYFLSHAPKSPLLKRWSAMGQAKVALQCKSEEEMQELQAKALSLGICARIIHDAGRTQIAAGSATVLGIGPAPKTVVDMVTGHLKLL
jgi:peptidyl-tRNA hydrolase, PTH2 family